jgi:catechol 2,3-dioxygenase-like lactoylglutathione lyase family enzyme
MTTSPIKTTSRTAFTKLTPNLLVSDVERSLAFYTSVLGFDRGFTVPEQSPFVFGSVVSGAIEIFFNERETAAKEYPAFAGKPLGITGTMYIELEGTGNIERLHDRLKTAVPVVMPLVTQWYGAKEFAIADPDGYVITFVERVAADPASA